MDKIVVLDPRQKSRSGAVMPAKRLPTLANKRIGLLWNSKHGGDLLLRQVAGILNEKHKLADVYFTRKMFIGNAAPKEIIDDLVSRVDAVICALGD